MSKTVTKEQVVRIQDAMRTTLASLLEAEGLMLTRGSAKYGDEGSLTFRFCAVDEDENGVNLASPEAQDFLNYAHTYEGGRPTQLGGVWTNRMSGEEFRVIGLRLRARKYPVLAESLRDGRKVGLPDSAFRTITDAA